MSKKRMGISLPGNPLFGSSQVVITNGAEAAFRRASQSVFPFLDRHFRGDWGDVPKEDAELNNRAYPVKERVMSSYKLNTGTKIWIITDYGHEVTTILLPEEY